MVCCCALAPPINSAKVQQRTFDLFIDQILHKFFGHHKDDNY